MDFRGIIIIKSVVRICKYHECRKWEIKHLFQQLPPLPPERTLYECYSAISLDVLGPLDMKLCAECHFNVFCKNCEQPKENGIKGTKKPMCKTKKIWVVLFGCLATRHVTLELLQDKCTEAFVMAFQRMTACHSTPRLIL